MPLVATVTSVDFNWAALIDDWANVTESLAAEVTTPPADNVTVTVPEANATELTVVPALMLAGVVASTTAMPTAIPFAFDAEKLTVSFVLLSAAVVTASVNVSAFKANQAVPGLLSIREVPDSDATVVEPAVPVPVTASPM